MTLNPQKQPTPHLNANGDTPSPSNSNPQVNLLPVSVIVLTFNEEQNIRQCLDSLIGWVGEVFILDSGSTDHTRDIATEYINKDKVVIHPFENYAKQRNWAQTNLPLTYEWVLHIDADERVTPELARSIRRFLAGPDSGTAGGAMFSRRTVFMGRWIRHGGHYPVYHTRLFRRDKGRCEDRLYDQHFVVDGPVVRLDGDLIDVLTPALEPWMLRHVRWATQEAQEAARLASNSESQIKADLRGTAIQRRRWLRTRLFGRAPLFLRAFAYFMYRYFLRFGFLDGVEGLVFHFLQGCWFRFYTDALIWEATRRQRTADRRGEVK